MYPARFEYHTPTTVDEALSLLVGHAFCCPGRFESDPSRYLAAPA